MGMKFHDKMFKLLYRFEAAINQTVKEMENRERFFVKSEKLFKKIADTQGEYQFKSIDSISKRFCIIFRWNFKKFHRS